ncbi:mitochondrial tRNA-specific 2-thiouridylase 1 isoform X2 [Periplaneta americana]|uniref:mitochondrial tRNA-specific 2-thiouridylase 1 isoform X2 n=1 Tax=Periplaneta americana TaxID=6978 RepID=UPI0037E96884
MLNIRRVIVAVSGGVDSAVAALILKKKGYDVVGVFMQNWDTADETGICSATQDAEDARWVCSRLGIPFSVVSFVREYWNDVFCNLLEDYQNGYTPNPDILCNGHIKFDKFLKYAQDNLDADAIATGHYASTTFGSFLENCDFSAGVHLLKPRDLFKDQTFFLSQVSQIPLQKTMFPLANLTKTQVKKIASEYGMDYISKKKESSGICFIGTRHFQNFISEYLNDSPGYFRDIDSGVIVGRHAGIHHWTIGQRCRIGGQLKPYYVARKEPKNNDIFVYAVFYKGRECLGSARITDLGSSLQSLGCDEQKILVNNAHKDIPNTQHMVVVITEDVQNVHLLLEYRPHIDVSLTCEHDPKLQVLAYVLRTCHNSILKGFQIRHQRRINQ